MEISLGNLYVDTHSVIIVFLAFEPNFVLVLLVAFNQK